MRLLRLPNREGAIDYVNSILHEQISQEIEDSLRIRIWLISRSVDDIFSTLVIDLLDQLEAKGFLDPGR